MCHEKACKTSGMDSHVEMKTDYSVHQHWSGNTWILDSRTCKSDHVFICALVRLFAGINMTHAVYIVYTSLDVQNVFLLTEYRQQLLVSTSEFVFKFYCESYFYFCNYSCKISADLD